MYVIKVWFPKNEAFPVAQVIDSELAQSEEIFKLAEETETLEKYDGYLINRDSFSFGIARRLAGQFLCSVGNNLRYAYTDGFLPDAKFIFEYDR